MSVPVFFLYRSGDEANKLRAQMRRGLSKGLNVKVSVMSPLLFAMDAALLRSIADLVDARLG